MPDRRQPIGRDCAHAVPPSRPASPDRTSAEFNRLRPYLLRVAYSHLGNLSEAEDLVQEAWLRLERTDRAEIRDLRAWLTTVISRLALDALTSARARRERYVGPWLPEPVVQDGDGGADPARRADLDEDVSMAMLIVLESLSPAERSAFLLHDVFGYSFEEVAGIVDRTPAATRKLAARARSAVEARRPRYPARAEEQREIVTAFFHASRDGDIAGLLELLDPSVTYRSDGGGAVPASRKTFAGAQRVARIFTAMGRHYGERYVGSVVNVNGAPGLLLEIGADRSVIAVTIDEGRITSLNVMRNPDKLTTLRGRTGASPDRI
jgi:RNA polymerase sigma-70 factor, ECF subfamily